MHSIAMIAVGAPVCAVHCSHPADPVQRFARRELLRYLRLIAGVKAPARPPRAETLVILAAGADADDGFEIRAAAGVLRITGNNPRSLLFGVYAFLERYAQCWWPHPGEDIVPRLAELRVAPARPWRENAGFRHRNVYPEGGRFSIKWMRQLADWASKNRVSDLTVSFSAWNKYRRALAPELARRGLALNLSGHCLSAFVPREKFRTHPDWFALSGGRRMERGQYCFSSPSFRRALQGAMLNFLAAEPLVRRISVWANDNAFKCECPACRRAGFMGSFSGCINELARACRRRFPGLVVDFLAYNAALNNSMLAPRGRLALSDCSVEFAYWGRDYRRAIGVPGRPKADIQAERYLRQWRRRVSNNLYVLEYYTDLWMHTHLAAPLPGIIARDARQYAGLGVDDIGTLIVLCPDNLNERAAAVGRLAPMVYPNLFCFAACAWNPKLNSRRLLQDYCRARFGPAGTLGLKYILQMEKTLAGITAFNRELFRLRFVDIWTRDKTPRQGGVKFVPADWTPAAKWTDVDRRRLAVCRRMLDELRLFERRNGWHPCGADRGQRANLEGLRARGRSIQARLEGLHWQLQAQQALRAGRSALTLKFLARALNLGAGISGAERRSCRRWRQSLLSADTAGVARGTPGGIPAESDR